ncbi:MAG: hypothetical protein IPL79_20410 [Myxococcales bacterium]|nr:hypothetical protein [Myxococcales bacterium]
MTLSFPAAPTAPDLNSPDTYNARVLAGFTWCFDTMPDYLTGLDAADFFPVQSSPADATAGRVLEVGASATVLSASPALRVTKGGTANAITLTTGASLGSLTTGLRLRFRATSANTAATTINVDGIGAAAAKTVTGAALPSGYIRSDADTDILYDGTNWIANREDEYGSNANGAYVRFANGFQTCWNTAQTLTYSSTQQVRVTWTYPAKFITSAVSGSVTATGATGDLTDLSRTKLGVVTISPSADYYGSFGLIITDSSAVVTSEVRNATTTATGLWY